MHIQLAKDPLGQELLDPSFSRLAEDVAVFQTTVGKAAQVETSWFLFSLGRELMPENGRCSWSVVNDKSFPWQF